MRSTLLMEGPAIKYFYEANVYVIFYAVCIFYNPCIFLCCLRLRTADILEMNKSVFCMSWNRIYLKLRIFTSFRIYPCIKRFHSNSSESVLGPTRNVSEITRSVLGTARSVLGKTFKKTFKNYEKRVIWRRNDMFSVL